MGPPENPKEGEADLQLLIPRHTIEHGLVNTVTIEFKVSISHEFLKRI